MIFSKTSSLFAHIFAFFAAVFVVCAITVIALSAPIFAHAQAEAEATPPNTALSSGVEKITSALQRLKDSAVRTGTEESDEVEAQRTILLSIVDYLLEETGRARETAEALSMSKAPHTETLINALKENEAWYAGMGTVIESVHSKHYLDIIAHDLRQFRDATHNTAIRAASELSFLERQQRLLRTIKGRLDKITDDIAALEAHNNPDASTLRQQRDAAARHIQIARSHIYTARILLGDILPPYKDGSHRDTLSKSRELLIESNREIREAYAIFIEMSRSVNAR